MEFVAVTGQVFLVGAGPGDPGLLTLRGLECLRQADLILYDGLVNPLLLMHSHANAERTCRTGEGHGKRLDQAEINARLVAAARDGKCVVRLKGGDPFIFGRGSEEAAALRTAGIPYEIVPGITAATAAGEYAGISLTHRAHASAVAFITGHEDPAKSDSRLDYDQLARFPGTLVFYMGLHRLPAIVDSLLTGGMSAETPACVISRATTPLQRTVTANLADLPEKIHAAGLHAPSLIIVGDCVTMREQLAWFEQRPLFGCRIGIPRAVEQAAETVSRAIELGAQPIVMPLIEIAPPDDWTTVDAAIEQLDTYDWLVFSSVNGIRAFFGRLWQQGFDSRRLRRTRLAAIGTSTAAALEEFHLRADIIPAEFRAESLSAEMQLHVAGKRVLWARASRGRDVLPERLTAAGADVAQVVVYQNRDVSDLPDECRNALEAGELDWIALSSPSIARNLSCLLTPAARATIEDHRTRLAAISPVTAAAAEECGLPISAIAETYNWEGLFAAIKEKHASR